MPPAAPTPGWWARSTARFEQVQALKARGKGIKPIMREVGLAKETVRTLFREIASRATGAVWAQ